MERDDKAHWGWNIYHYAVYGYQINCSYLLESPDIPPEILNEQVREGGGGGGGGRGLWTSTPVLVCNEIV